LYEVPLNEAGALFARLVSRVLFECVYNTEHGLDCYLSLRIRHGTLSGQLRGPVEQEKVVTRRDASSGTYQPNQHWAQVLAGNMSRVHLTAVLERLASFSESYDKLIGEITDNLIQVRRGEKPEGPFEFSIPELSIYGLATEVDSSTSFETFLDKCFEVFWSLLNTSLVKVRSYIDVDLRARIRDKFDELERELFDIPSDAIGWLADSMRRARTETGLRLDTMRDWFTLPTPSSAIPLSIDELIAVGLATVKNFQPEFEPRVNIVRRGEVPSFLVGGLRLFSDIFFILFGNIGLYSGNPKDPRIEIEYWETDDRLWFRVENELSGDIDLDKSIESTKAARARIESGAYLSAVRREGGTGLPKLAKLIKGSDLKPPIEFNLDESRMRFVVEFAIRWTAIPGGTGSAKNETVAS